MIKFKNIQIYGAYTQEKNQEIDKTIAEMFILNDCWNKVFEKYDLIPSDFL